MSEQAKSYLLIINDAPGDGERPYNALRLALNLVKRPAVRMRVFLLGEGVKCAQSAQPEHEDLVRIERMIVSIARRGEVVT